MEEIIDIYNSKGVKIGTASKKAAHRQGLWHIIFHCWIIGNNGKLWFQLRHKDKQPFPNQLAPTVTGHLKTGEHLTDGIREIKEELGIKVSQSQLEFLFSSSHQLRAQNGDTHKHLDRVFLLKSSLSLSDVKLQKSEVSGIFEADIQDLYKLFSGKEKSIKIQGLEYNNKNTLQPQEKIVRLEDFSILAADYYLKSLEQIQKKCTNNIDNRIIRYKLITNNQRN